jgi:Fur family ferric uptake transcriptional regulator
MNSPDQMLKTHRLRLTPGRQAILGLFLRKKHALSHGDIERWLQPQYDRVTVYRTLRTFLKRGLIHKVLDDEGSLKYALCSEACSTAAHRHNHVHFKCRHCGETSCLEVEIPPVKLPRGYQPSEWNLLIQGICRKCL